MPYLANEIALAQEAIENGRLPKASRKALETLFSNAYQDQYAFIKCDGDSIFLGSLYTYLGDPSVLLAKEIFWYSRKPSKSSVKFFLEFENWAKQMGAQEIFIESLVNTEKVDSFFISKGYSKGATIYRKELNNA